MKAAELRQSILQAAIQGKLVPQDMHDEPAALLLNRIREEKVHLINEGKIKKERFDRPLEEDELPYEVPEGWEWVRLGELTEKVGAGSTPTGGRNVYVTSGVKFIRSQNVWNDGLRVDSVAYIDDKIHQCMLGSTVLAQDILINITGASIGRCCIVPDRFDFANINQHVIIIRLVERSLREFIHKVIISPYIQKYIMDVQVGVSREGLSAAKLTQFAIPLPPLAEQRRIVTKVDELMVLCDELEKAEQELDDLDKNFLESLPNSILQATVHGRLMTQNIHDEPAEAILERIRFEKTRQHKKEMPLAPISEDEIPYDLPEGWVWCRLGFLVSFKNGLSKRKSDNGKPCFVMRLADIDKDKFSLKSARKIMVTEDEIINYSLSDRNLIIIRVNGSKNNVGRSVLCDNLEPGCLFCDHLMRLDFWGENNIRYIWYAINTPQIQALIDERIITTAGQHTINQQSLASICFPLPPLAEQQRIVAILDKLMDLCNRLIITKTLPVIEKGSNGVIIDFPVTKPKEVIRLAAHGNVRNKPSAEFIQAVEDMFEGD